MNRALLPVLALLLLGCASAPEARYYLIQGGLGAPPAVEERLDAILAVETPEVLDRYRADRVAYVSERGELGYYNYRLWADPVPVMVREALIASLRGSGLFRAVVRGGDPERPGIILQALVTGFEEVDEKDAWFARFSAEITIVTAGGRVLERLSVSRKVSAEERTPRAVADALGRAVGEAAAELLPALRGAAGR